MIPKEKLEELTKSLLEDKERLEKNIKALKDTEFGDSPGQDNESADETEEMVNSLGKIKMFEEHIEQIDKALEKIETGQYGECEGCSVQITEDVLGANPSSTLCKDCKN